MREDPPIGVCLFRDRVAMRGALFGDRNVGNDDAAEDEPFQDRLHF